jgi:3,4-dihydroxy 2-butanone 4-phosphate synthase/GTP cyclohydrolase II
MLSQLREMAARSATAIQEHGREIPPEHVMRDYGLGAQIIRDLGLKRITVLTDHPKDLIGMAGYGIEVAGHVPLTGSP